MRDAQDRHDLGSPSGFRGRGLRIRKRAIPSGRSHGMPRQREHRHQRVMSEMRDGTVISDQKLITIGLYCAGR
jgi:hypothetical protein